MRSLNDVRLREKPLETDNFRKPIFRSSCLFPLYEENGIHSRITFLSYWLLRSIKEVAIVLTIRDANGELAYRSHLLIDEPRVFVFDVRELLAESGKDVPRRGSIEMEVFTSRDLVFPFPAVVVNYYGDQFSTSVHTTERVFNDAEDAAGSMTVAGAGIEAGFNIYGDQDRDPFISVVNGSDAYDESEIELIVSSMNGATASHRHRIGPLRPYQSVTIQPSDYFDLAALLGDRPGTMAIKHNLKGVFPRLIVGNQQPSLNGVSITHTIYDMTSWRTDSDYWPKPGDEWLNASRMLPIFSDGDMYTRLYFYPVLSPCKLDVDCELFSATGKLLGTVPGAGHIDCPDGNMGYIDFREMADNLGIARQDIAGSRISLRPVNGGHVPSRVSMGLDIGYDNKPGRLPTNVSFALQVPIPAREERGSSFRWGPLLADNSNPIVHLSNASVLRNTRQSANVKLTVYRSEDNQLMEKNLIIPPNGSYMLDASEGTELHDFLQGSVGWYTASADTANLDTWYLARHKSGIVGGDHGF
ncbi:MAG: hypothetical protein IIB15_02810 [Chloroflexi bacterium]|nr:hypothetical protein [Chloroflexota bacterium]